jgi:hypothetical protein
LIVTVVLPLAVAGGLLASTRLSITGRFRGLYLRHAAAGRPLILQDDLRLGEEERLLVGLDFGRLGRWLRGPPPGGPGLEVEFDEVDGSGMVTVALPGGRTLETAFGRFLHDDDREVHGLFVGGGRAEILHQRALDESGVSLHDAAGWHHVWCTVNEAVWVAAERRLLDPPDWQLVAARLVQATPAQAVLESEHRVATAQARLAMHRRATFRAGQPFFALDVRITNVGAAPVELTYGYGDEPWVGRFGSAEGNVGWVREGVVPVAARLDPLREGWGGIVDTRTGLANLLAWAATPPDLAYFNNHGGPPTAAEAGRPLASNEITVGLEWQRRRLPPGGALAVRLLVGLADRGPGGGPALPPAAWADLAPQAAALAPP